MWFHLWLDSQLSIRPSLDLVGLGKANSVHLQFCTVMVYRVQDKFKTGLLSSSEEFKRQVLALLEDFRAKGPFGSHILCTKAFEIIANIKLQLIQLKEDEASLRRGLAIFKIDLPPSKEIAKVEVVCGRI